MSETAERIGKIESAGSDHAAASLPERAMEVAIIALSSLRRAFA